MCPQALIGIAIGEQQQAKVRHAEHVDLSRIIRDGNRGGQLLQSLSFGQHDKQLAEGIPVRFFAAKRSLAYGDPMGKTSLPRRFQ